MAVDNMLVQCKFEREIDEPAFDEQKAGQHGQWASTLLNFRTRTLAVEKVRYAGVATLLKTKRFWRFCGNSKPLRDERQLSRTLGAPDPKSLHSSLMSFKN